MGAGSREVSGGRFLGRFEDKLFRHELFERTLHPRRLLELSGRNPKLLLSWVHLIRELGIERSNEELFPEEFFERAFHPRHLLDIVERNPEAAMTWLQVVTELGGDRFIERHGQELFERVFDRFVVSRLLYEKPTAFAIALRLARISQSSRAIEIVEKCLAANSRDSRFGRVPIGALPISALSDVEWLAKKSGNPELRSALRKLYEGRERD